MPPTNGRRYGETDVGTDSPGRPLPSAASREIGGCHLPPGGRQERGGRPRVYVYDGDRRKREEGDLVREGRKRSFDFAALREAMTERARSRPGEPFRQPPRGRSAAATSPEGGGKSVGADSPGEAQGGRLIAAPTGDGGGGCGWTSSPSDSRLGGEGATSSVRRIAGDRRLPPSPRGGSLCGPSGTPAPTEGTGPPHPSGASREIGGCHLPRGGGKSVGADSPGEAQGGDGRGADSPEVGA